MKRDWNLQTELDDLRAQGLWRELRVLDEAEGPLVRREGRALVNFSSNDYLGLCGSAELKTALQDALQRHGSGSGASRLVCGTHRAHAHLEEALAAFKRTEAALAFSSGFSVALGVIPALVGAGDTIILDKLSHACLVDAARLSGATIRVFPHNHLEKLARLLATAQGRVLIVTESVFSMDGDTAPLREIIELKEKHGAWLLLDEAHAVGVLGPRGRGLAAQLGLEDRVDLHMGTLSKALGLSGGYLAASRCVVDLLINRARSFIYSTAPPPFLADAAASMLALVAGSAGDLRRETLQKRLSSLRAAFPGEERPAAIFPVIFGEEIHALQAAESLLEAGFLVPAIRFPTVARGAARLRVTVGPSHSEEQVRGLVDALKGLK